MKSLRARMAIAALALVNSLVATYLTLWKMGKVGTLACTSGHGCERAMLSRFGYFLGVDVALIGAIGYALVTAVAVWGIQPGWAQRRAPSVALLALVGFAFAFTVRLKYGEWFVLHTFCPWCFINVVIVLLLLPLTILDLRGR